MFRTFASVPGVGAETLFLLHPADLLALLELAWDRRFTVASAPLGSPLHRSALSRFEHSQFGKRTLAPPFPPGLQPAMQAILGAIEKREESGIAWDHLIYAYMIENTRVYMVFRQVVHELTEGEKLGSPSIATQHWLRSTEQLFYRDAPPLFASAVTSRVRPDDEGTRRAAYQRLLGLDLNHGTADNKPYPFVRAEAANKEFAATFEELLREVWVGVVNASNFSGVNPTDNAKLADLLKKLHDMLLSRRVNGNLSREEFAFVSMMSWFHLTLESDSSVVVDLRAQAASAEQRLFKIAQQVGVPAHGLSASYFDVADAVSRVLIVIETGVFEDIPGTVPLLYTPGSPLEPLMRTVITHWSVITGRDIKAGKVAPLESPRRPS
jgi:hypothetical protein